MPTYELLTFLILIVLLLYYFQNGIIQGANMGFGSLGTCNILPLRCSLCRQGGQASLAKSWRSQKKFCVWGSPVGEGSSLIISPITKD